MSYSMVQCIVISILFLPQCKKIVGEGDFRIGGVLQSFFRINAAVQRIKQQLSLDGQPSGRTPHQGYLRQQCGHGRVAKEVVVVGLVSTGEKDGRSGREKGGGTGKEGTGAVVETDGGDGVRGLQYLRQVVDESIVQIARSVLGVGRDDNKITAERAIDQVAVGVDIGVDGDSGVHVTAAQSSSR